MDASQWKSPVHKRIACDRCHARKLRCLREFPTSKCSRCIQEGCVCTYSPPLKSGRPKKTRPPVPVDHFDLDTKQAADQPQIELSPMNTNQHCLPSRKTGDIASPYFLPSMLPNPETENIGATMDLPGVNSLSGTGPSVMDFTNEAPSSPGISENTLWSDLLQTNKQPPPHSTELPTYASDTHIHTNVFGGLETPPDDDEACRDSIIWIAGCGDGAYLNLSQQSNIFSQIASSNLDDQTHKPDSDHNKESRSLLLEKLSQLQNELVQSTKVNPSDNVVLPSVGHSTSTCNNGPDILSQKHPVNAVLRPGQDLIGIINDLLAKCDAKAPNQREHCLKDATLLLFVITPLSLLLSTYDRLLKEISSTKNPGPSHSSDRGMPAGSNAAPYIDDAHNQTTHQNGSFQSRQMNSCDGLGSYPTLLSDNPTINLGEMNLDQQTQLVVVVTIVNRHLIYLELALDQYQSRRMDGRITRDLSERLFSTLMSEMRASIKLLKGQARDLL